ncbi:unnamed protein product [Bathycoccus prasinos]
MDGLFSRFTSAPMASKPPPLFFNAFLQSVKVVLPDGMLASSSVAASVVSSFLFAMMIFVFIFWPKSAKRLPRKFLVPASASNETERKWRPKPRFVKPKKFSKESKEFGEEYAGDFSSDSDDEEGDEKRIVVGPKEIPAVVKEMKEKVKRNANVPIEKRIEQLTQLKRLVKENEEAICDALYYDMGRPRLEAFIYDVFIPLQFETLSQVESKVQKSERAFVGTDKSTEHAVVRAAAVWVGAGDSALEFPVFVGVGTGGVGRLRPGVPLVVRPSNDAKYSAKLLHDLIAQYMDPDVCRVVGAGHPGDGIDTMNAVLDQKEFDVVFFTGSSRVGRIVAKKCAEHLTPCVLELGGKNPVIVSEDCGNVDLAAKQCVWGRMLNCGQQCVSPDYVLVHESIEKEFTEKCEKWVKTFFPRYDVPEAMGRLGGPEARIAMMAKEAEEMKNSKAEKIICGGKVIEVLKMAEPTIVKVLDADEAVCMRKEAFAPILSILAVKSTEEAIEFINDKYPNPLSLYIFSKSAKTQRLILDNTKSGGVCINSVIYQAGHEGLPFGGVGESGYGSHHGLAGVESFRRWKPVLQKTRWLSWFDFGLVSDSNIVYPPYGRKLHLVKSLLRLARLF